MSDCMIRFFDSARHTLSEEETEGIHSETLAPTCKV